MWDVGVDTIQVSGRNVLNNFCKQLFRIFINTRNPISADMFVSFARCRLRYLNTQRRVKTAWDHSFQGFEH